MNDVIVACIAEIELWMTSSLRAQRRLNYEWRHRCVHNEDWTMDDVKSLKVECRLKHNSSGSDLEERWLKWSRSTIRRDSEKQDISIVHRGHLPRNHPWCGICIIRSYPTSVCKVYWPPAIAVPSVWRCTSTCFPDTSSRLLQHRLQSGQRRSLRRAWLCVN